MMKKLILLLIGTVLILPARAETLNILKIGGKNDGKTLNTKAIAKGIERLSAQGGGTLYFPAGTYLTGPITMKSNITLHIDAGAVLSFTDDFDAYMPYVEMRFEGVVMNSFHPLIGGWDAENICLKGEGILEGNGNAWWQEHYRVETEVAQGGAKNPTRWQKAFLEANPDLTLEPQSDWKNTLARHFFRPPFVQFFRCRNIRIEGLLFRNSPFWTINPEFCDNLTIDGVTINNPHSPNTDGINPESCRNVHISNCHISVGDDCITIKSGRDLQGRQYATPCENITITNCTMLNGHGGVVIGSEMSGDVRKVTISNCVFDGTNRGIRLKSSRGRGGIVEEIRVNNIVMKDIQDEAIILTLFYGRSTEEPVSDRTPIFRNIHIANMTGSEVNSLGGIVGIPEMPISNISISNVNIDAKSGMRIRDAENLTFNDFTLSTQQGPALSMENVREVYIDNVRTYKPNADAPVMSFLNVRDVLIRGCFPMPGSKALAEFAGPRTRGIVLMDNHTERLATPFIMGPDLNADAIDAKLEEKAAGWVAGLNLGDPAKEARVTRVIATHLQAISDWHDSHATLLPAGTINPRTGQELSAVERQVAADSAMPKSVKQALMDGLNADLSPEQVEYILDQYTVGKVEFTMNGYRSIVPDITPEDEAVLYKNLKEARLRAVDYKEMREISAIFEIYKTLNEQYFTNSGRDWRTMYQAYYNKVQAEKAAAAKN